MEKPHLTANDKKILKKISEQGRASDTEISKDMSISQQAVYQIRKKLEEQGVIEGYIPIIDYEKLGIGIFTIVGIRIRSTLWEKFSESEINSLLKELPNIHSLFRISSSDISYIMTLGFEDLKESEKLLKKIETMLSEAMTIEWSHVITIDNILKDDGLNLVYQATKAKKTDVEVVLSKFLR